MIGGTCLLDSVAYTTLIDSLDSSEGQLSNAPHPLLTSSTFLPYSSPSFSLFPPTPVSLSSPSFPVLLPHSTPVLQRLLTISLLERTLVECTVSTETASATSGSCPTRQDQNHTHTQHWTKPLSATHLYLLSSK